MLTCDVDEVILPPLALQIGHDLRLRHALLGSVGSGRRCRMSRLDTTMAALATMSSAQLRCLWAETFDTPVPPVPDSLLRRALAQSMQETTLGGLSAVARRSMEALASGGSAVQQDLCIKFKPGTRLMGQPFASLDPQQQPLEGDTRQHRLGILDRVPGGDGVRGSALTVHLGALRISNWRP